MQVTIDADQLKDVLSHDHGLKTLLEAVLNQVLEAEMTDHVGAEPYEPTNQRRTYLGRLPSPPAHHARGHAHAAPAPEPRRLVPWAELFRRYQRSEQALVLSLMEMVLQGVSTRKVTRITEQLCSSVVRASPRAP